MKRYFITGTDTDCGKTYVTRTLLELYPDSVAIKPVASGCSYINGELINPDAQYLHQNSSLSMAQINPWRFELAASPHIAAQKEGRTIVVQEVVEYCMTLAVEGKDTLFIEGAGGLLVPLNDNETWLDFLKLSGIPVILVVGIKLGCINHALLTEQVLLANHIQCAGWVANCLEPEMLTIEESVATIKGKLAMPLLAVVPFGVQQDLSSLFNFESCCPGI